MTGQTLLLADFDALRGVIDAVPHPIFVKDDQLRFVVVNETMCRFMGRSFDEMVGRSDGDFVPRDQAEVFRGNDLRVLATGESSENEELFTDEEGKLRTIVTRKKRLTLASGANFIVGSITDISDFRQAEALIRHHAGHDPLTGLANRRQFGQQIEQALTAAAKQGRDCFVFLVDLDRFKPVNDQHGHTAGDAVLCEVAARLKAIARKGDVVARLGGDEFALLCADKTAPGVEAARRIATRIIDEMKRPIVTGNLVVSIGASVGIARSPADGSTPDALLHAADIAMYRGKRDGRGGYRFFEKRMDAEIREQAALENDLRDAISADAIVPYFQPLMALKDGRLLGFEILSRWEHHRRGFVPPDVFIPLAEKLGLISKLTYSVLRSASLTARTWPDHLTLSLNVSPSQLRDSLLPVHLLGVLSDTGFPPGRLEVEITENALVSDVKGAKAILASFRNLGIKVALDDFGTGYSSLHHLRELQFDRIKIDRSFVQAIGTDPESAKIVNAILGLSKSLGLPATAEGIESAEILEHLALNGAEVGQGYFFGKAVPAAEVGAMFSPRVARRRKVG